MTSGVGSTVSSSSMTTVFGSNSWYCPLSRKSRVMFTNASVPAVSGARPMLSSVWITVSVHIWFWLTPPAIVWCAPLRSTLQLAQFAALAARLAGSS